VDEGPGARGPDRRALAVVARRPRLGAVKKRLATAIGEEGALRVYRELLGGTLRSAEQLARIEQPADVEQSAGVERLVRDERPADVELVLALAPDEGPADEGGGDGRGMAQHSPPPITGLLTDLGRDGDGEAAAWRLIAQRGAHLGERLANLFADLFAEGFAAVAIIDSDSPALPPEYLRQAFALLAGPQTTTSTSPPAATTPGGRMVIGPSTDGGYYLVGTDAATWRSCSGAVAKLLAATPMGSPAALAYTVRTAAANGLTVQQLPLWTDVDDGSDLPLMERLLRPGSAGDRPRGEPLAGLREIYLHVTNRCGLSCPHCYNRDNPRTAGEMTTAEWKHTVDASVALGAGSFVIIGGDPFLRHDLFELIDHITGAHGCKARLFFSGLVTEETAAELSRVGRGLLRPLVSVDGSADVNDRLRYPGNFADALTAIRNLVAVGLSPVVNTVLLAPVLPVLSDMARALRAAGVTRLHLILPHHRGGLPLHLDLAPSGAAIAAAVGELFDTAAAIGMTVDNLAAFAQRLDSPRDFCACGCGDLAIDPFGKVHACTITCGDPAFVAGDLRATDLETIWRASPGLTLLRNVHARDRLECAACPIVDACGGECWMQAHYAARAREAPAGYVAPFPYCDFVRLVFERVIGQAGAEAPVTGARCPAGARAGGGGGGAADYALFDCI